MNSPSVVTEFEETPARFTVEEFLAIATQPPMADWRGKIELVNGVITHMSPANMPHWDALRLTLMLLHEAMKDVPGDWIVGPEPTVRLIGQTVRQPDVAILYDRGQREGIFDASALFLAIEISDSSLPIDLGSKRLGYAEASVPYYWVVDVRARCVHVMSDVDDGDYRERTIVAHGEPLTIPETNTTITLD